MNLDKINRWLALLGNLGVVLGIIFLGVELQNNTRATEAQTRDSITAKLMDWQMAIATNFDVAELWREGNRGWLPEPNQRTAYSQLVQSSFRLWENEYYQYQIGLYSDAEIQPRIDRWQSSLSRWPGMAGLWCQNNYSFAADFRDLLNSFVNEVMTCDAAIEQYRATRT